MKEEPNDAPESVCPSCGFPIDDARWLGGDLGYCKDAFHAPSDAAAPANEENLIAPTEQNVWYWTCRIHDVIERKWKVEDISKVVRELLEKDTHYAVRAEPEKINTRCPACDSQTLMIGSGGLLVCSLIGCPNPMLINNLSKREQSRTEQTKELPSVEELVSVYEYAWGKADHPKHRAGIAAVREAIISSLREGDTYDAVRAREAEQTIVDLRRENAEKAPPIPEGVFKGAQGLQELADCNEFWDRQMYGTRFYFSDLSYLHRGVLRYFLADYALAKSNTASHEMIAAKEALEMIKGEAAELGWKDNTIMAWIRGLHDDLTTARDALRKVEEERDALKMLTKKRFIVTLEEYA